MNSDHSINKYTSFAYSVLVLWHVTLGRVSIGKVLTDSLSRKCLFFSFCRIKTLETVQKQSKRQDANCRTWYWNMKTLMTSNVTSDNHFSAQDYTYPGDLNLANYEMTPVSKLFFFSFVWKHRLHIMLSLLGGFRLHVPFKFQTFSSSHVKYGPDTTWSSQNNVMISCDYKVRTMRFLLLCL